MALIAIPSLLGAARCRARRTLDGAAGRGVPPIGSPHGHLCVSNTSRWASPPPWPPSSPPPSSSPAGTALLHRM